jgi:hypothetical protein
MEECDHRWGEPQPYTNRTGDEILVTPCLDCNAFTVELVGDPGRSSEWFLDRLAEHAEHRQDPS